MPTQTVINLATRSTVRRELTESELSDRAQQAQEHAERVVIEQALVEAMAARERLLDALAAGDPPDPDDRAKWRARPTSPVRPE